MITIGRMTLLVHDLDVAKTFYVQGFGFDTLFDGEVGPPPGLRTVHVGPLGPRGAGLWLMQSEQPELSAAARAQNAGEPSLVLYTDDLDSALARLRRIHVQPVQGPDADETGSRFAHILDPSGNEIVLVQLPVAPTEGDPAYRPGTIGLLEFPTDDPDRSARFYRDLFGWEVSNGPYRMFRAGELSGAFPDTVNGFPAVREVIEPGDVIPYVVVEDIEASLATARELGATVLLGRTRTAPDHEMALIADPSGAKIALARSGNLDD